MRPASLLLLAITAAHVAATATAQLAWTALSESFPRTGVRMAFDSGRGRLVLFGGQRIFSPIDDLLLESDGGPWRSLTPPGASPSARTSTAIAFDAARAQTVLFGGYDAVARALTDETWTWDGTGWRLETATAPAPRFGHAMAYDPVRQRVVMFGGLTDGLVSQDDTWEWDGSTWTRIQPAVAPIPRWGHAMTFDTTRGRILLCGGAVGPSLSYVDTWEWDGTTWTERTSATTRPSKRYNSALAYDPTRQRAVLHGGAGGGNETWEWDGQSWQLRRPLHQPSAVDHALAFDPTRQRVVLYGVTEPYTWAWDGSDWSLDMQRSLPQPWIGARMLWDPIGQRTLMFGCPSTDQRELWSLDGSTWRLVDVGMAQTRLAPDPAVEAGWVFDTRRGVGVLFGGRSGSSARNEHWEFDGTRWRLMQSTPPSHRSAHVCVYDEARGRVVVFGGQGVSVLDDTWEWDGVRWRTFTPVNVPPARRDAASTYDAVRERVVIFGGRTVRGIPLDDTWEWDGRDWTWRRPPLTPPARGGAAMTWDPARRRAVMVGGIPDDGQVWEWNGATWNARAVASPPSARESFACVHDGGQDRLVLFGGLDPSVRVTLGDTWELRVVDPARAEPYGDGCPGTAHTLDAVTLPWIGETFTVAADGFAPSVPVVLWAGFSDSSWAGGSLPAALDAIGMAGCTLLVSPDVPLAMTGSPAGRATADLVLPNDPALVGGRLFFQAFGVEPAANPLGIAATHALAALLGAP